MSFTTKLLKSARRFSFGQDAEKFGWSRCSAGAAALSGLVSPSDVALGQRRGRAGAI
jgi:hypothetical protein